MSAKVVVTGATGFVGGCVVEALFHAGGYDVIPVGRRPNAAGRVARFGCRLRVADLADAPALREAVSGVDAVVHCAFGGDVDPEAGMRNLVGAAADAGVKTFVHVSSTEVYQGQEGTLDEDCPIQTEGEGYGAVKGRLEQVVRGFRDRFGTLIILRPSIIYGPLSDQWTIAPIRRMLAGWRPRAEELSGAANLVHIGDLCSTIRACLGLDASGLRVYNVVGPEVVPWGDYFTRLSAQLDSGRAPPSAGAGAELGMVRTLLRLLPTDLRRRATDLAVSTAVGRDVISRWRRMNLANLTAADLRFYARDVRYSGERAIRDGMAPRVSVDAGVRQCAEWARLIGLAP